MFLNCNGQIHLIATPIFGADNRAFKYGDALFETIRMVGGQPLFLDLHMDRLQAGMELLQMIAPPTWTIHFWEQAIHDLSQKNKIIADARIKLTIFRKEGGMYTPHSNQVSFLLEVSPLDTVEYEFNSKGLMVDCFFDLPKLKGPLAAIKSANALPYILAGIYAKKNQLDDCLLVNEHGNLVEAVASNVYLVKNNTIYTPDLSEGCVAGVMRRVIKEKIGFMEQAIAPAALLEADEVFLSNAIKGVQWVGAYKTKRYFNRVSKELCSMLNGR